MKIQGLTNKILDLRERLSDFIYPKTKSELKRYKELYKTIIKSDKVFVLSPFVEIKGASKIKTPVTLVGDGAMNLKNLTLEEGYAITNNLHLSGTCQFGTFHVHSPGKYKKRSKK